MARSEQGHGVHALIDRRVVPAVLLALVLALTLRGSYVWTNGAVNLFDIPVLGWILSAGVGLSIAACCELLMSVAGREWLRYRRLAYQAISRRDLRQGERESQARQYQGQARMSRAFMAVGFSASVFSGVWFLWSLAPHAGLSAAVIDGLVTILATVSFLYFGALREDPGTDPAERLEAEANRALFSMVESAAGMLQEMRGGELTPGVLARLISDGLPVQLRAKFAPVVAQLAPPDGAVSWWDVGQIYTYAGATSEALKRGVRRKLKALYDTGAPGVRKDERGAWIVAAALAREQLGAEHDAAILRQAQGAPAGALLLTGQETATARQPAPIV